MTRVLRRTADGLGLGVLLFGLGTLVTSSLYEGVLTGIGAAFLTWTGVIKITDDA